MPTYIGVTTGHDADHTHYDRPAAYMDSLETAGAVVILLPPLSGEALRALYGLLDGLVLSGGVDVDPSRYGQQPSPQLGAVDDARDVAELQLARWALADGMPLMGICRGIQTLNVAAGGTLIQDISSSVPGALRHATDRSLPRAYHAHDVTVEPGSRLGGLLGRNGSSDKTVAVNSWHHQAVQRVAKGFRVVASATDGIVEAIESVNGSPAFGVQWHPECMAASDPVMAGLFAGFLEMCRT